MLSKKVRAGAVPNAPEPCVPGSRAPRASRPRRPAGGAAHEGHLSSQHKERGPGDKTERDARGVRGGDRADRAGAQHACSVRARPPERPLCGAARSLPCKQDAAAKLTEAKAALESKQKAGATEVQQRADELARKYEAEKTAALAEWSKVRASLQAKAEEQLRAATSQLEEVRAQTGRELARLEQALTEATSSRSKGNEELERVVKTHNAKYSAMLAEQLGEQV